MISGRKRLLVIVILTLALCLLLLSACNMPGRPTPTSAGLDPIATFAAQTVQAQLTQVSKPLPTYANMTPSVTLFASTTPQLTSEVGNTGTPEATSGVEATCNIAKFVKDVSIPDNTEFAPGTTFVKTWRIENIGNCTWTADYSIFFYQGDKMDAVDSIPFSKNVAPGESVDISISMVAPESPGAYKGEWKLRDASSREFGVGENAKPIWVQILVVTESGIDFISKASSAHWRSGAPEQDSIDLTFNGDINDPNGAVKILDGVLLESGRISGKVLLLYPNHHNQGWISGTYQQYLIQRGNHFEARVGFIVDSDNKCGAGNVIFQLQYKQDDKITTLGEWQKSCDGSLLPIDIDLSRLAGKTVQFILSVKANGSYKDDWAIWNSPQITK